MYCTTCRNLQPLAAGRTPDTYPTRQGFPESRSAAASRPWCACGTLRFAGEVSERSADWPASLTSPPPVHAEATAPSHARFVLHKTDNLYTSLLLDTETGRLWQAQYATSPGSFRGVVPISTEKLADGKSGRFSLTKTENTWTFIHTDTDNGRLWQCQFSMRSEDRLCVPVDVAVKNANRNVSATPGG